MVVRRGGGGPGACQPCAVLSRPALPCPARAQPCVVLSRPALSCPAPRCPVPPALSRLAEMRICGVLGGLAAWLPRAHVKPPATAEVPPPPPDRTLVPHDKINFLPATFPAWPHENRQLIFYFCRGLYGRTQIKDQQNENEKVSFFSSFFSSSFFLCFLKKTKGAGTRMRK